MKSAHNPPDSGRSPLASKRNRSLRPWPFIFSTAFVLNCAPTLFAATGSAVAWGGGQRGFPEGLTNVSAISVGVDHTLALKSDGSVVAWGNNFDGQCNLPGGLGKVAQIAAGDFFSLALTTEGSLVAWGANDYGQCDVPSGLGSLLAISAGHAHCLALKANGTVVAWGSDIYGQSDVPAGLTGVKAIVAAWNYSLALKSDGSVVGWGVNDAGQTGVPAGLNTVVAIAGNETYAMAVKHDGTVVTWGTAPAVPAGLTAVSSVAAGENHSLALKRDGTLVAWGANDTGESSVPNGLERVSAIAAGWRYSAALFNSNAAPVPVQFVSHGTYSGLFYPGSNLSVSNSGAFSITVTTRRAFTGVLQMARARYAFRGTLDTNGFAEFPVPRRNLGSLDVSVQLVGSDTAEQLTGSVSTADWSSALTANRSVFNARTNPAPQAGLYTMVIPGSVNSATLPGGDSFGTVSVDPIGRARLAGVLADNTRFSQSSSLGANGQAPLFVPLYGGQGFILSWLNFAATAASDLDGDFNWIKPAQTKGKYYPGGFTLRTNAFGSHYHAPARGGMVLNLTNATAVFAGGNLTQSFTNDFTLGPGNRVTNTSSNKLTLSFSSGLFRGVVKNPANSKPLAFNGVVLQNTNQARGFFLGTNQSGQVLVRSD